MILLRQRNFSKKRGESITFLQGPSREGDELFYKNGESVSKLSKKEINDLFDTHSKHGHQNHKIASRNRGMAWNVRGWVETNPFKKHKIMLEDAAHLTVSDKNIKEAFKDHLKSGTDHTERYKDLLLKDLKKGMVKRRINQGLVVAIPTAATIAGIKALKKKKSKKEENK